MSRRAVRACSRTLSFAVAWMTLAATFSVSQLDPFRSRGQQADKVPVKAPNLEIVSVKKVKDSGGWHSVTLTADGINARDASLWLLIRTAFEAQFVAENQIVGEPSWSRSEQYDIAGKVSAADVANLHNLTNQQRAQVREAMLQEILYGRFQMKSHREDRQGPIYALVVEKNGLKMKDATPGAAYSNGIKEPGGSAMGEGGIQIRPGHITGQAASLKQLAEALTPSIGRVVVDETELTGRYDFTLTWTPDRGGPPPGIDGAVPPPNAEGPSIFTAIREQLGLKLEPTKGPVKTLIIDHVERPSEN